MKSENRQRKKLNSATNVVGKTTTKTIKNIKCYTPKCKRKWFWVTICKWDL